MKKSHQKYVGAALALIGIFATAGYLVSRQQEVPPQPATSAVLPLPPEATPEVEEVVPSEGQPYRAITVISDKPGAEIAREVGVSNVAFVLSFNRLDENHIRKDTTITIPPIFTAWNALSPFPHDLPVAYDIPKLLLVSQRIQAAAAYENGTLVRWMVTSTGKKDTPTPSKLYFTNWKGKLVQSTLEGNYMLPWAFNLESMEGIALHQFDLPGYPASHACIRLLEADAMWIYDWAKQWILDASGQVEIAKGTPVIVFGEYAYGKTAPWKKLAKDPKATTLTVDELTEVLNANIDEIQIEGQKRAQVEDSN